MKLNQFYVDNLIKEAISEDINYIDVSADYLIPEDQRNDSYFVAKADGVICGLDIAMRVFTLLDDTFTYTVHKNDGDEVKAGDLIVEFNGKKVTCVSDLLAAKREFKAGETTEFKVWRSGEYLDLTITFDEYIAESNISTSNNSEKNFQQQLEEYYNQYNQYQKNPYSGGNSYSVEDFLNEFVFGY